jgi:hypothetical protein
VATVPLLAFLECEYNNVRSGQDFRRFQRDDTGLVVDCGFSCVFHGLHGCNA